jgi:hypothetical protein
LAKLGATGAVQWVKGFGGAVEDAGEALALDSAGNVVLTGSFFQTITIGSSTYTSAGDSDIFVAKFDDKGTSQWARCFGGSHVKGSGSEIPTDIGYGVALDAKDNIYLAGQIHDAVDFGGGKVTAHGMEDAFLVKLDASGKHLWSKSFGGSSMDHAGSVSVSPSGQVVVSGGSCSSKLDLGGGPLKRSGMWDLFVGAFDASGKHLWSKGFGGVDNDIEAGAALDGSGNLLLTGFFFQTIDFGGGQLTSADRTDIFVAKLAP